MTSFYSTKLSPTPTSHHDCPGLSEFVFWIAEQKQKNSTAYFSHSKHKTQVTAAKEHTHIQLLHVPLRMSRWSPDFPFSTKTRPTLTKYFPWASAVLCGALLACRHVKLRCEHLKSCCQCSFTDYRLSRSDADVGSALIFHKCPLFVCQINLVFAHQTFVLNITVMRQQ